MRKVRQRGVSLIEVMVSLTIGILLLLGLGSIYQVANQSSKTTQILAANAEAARQVFNRLEYDLKRAGFVDLYDRPKKGFTGAFSGKLPTTSSTGSGSITCPDDSFTVGSKPVVDGKRYSTILANKQSTDMGTIYLRWQPGTGGSGKGSPTTRTLTELNKAFMTPVGYISCGTMRPVFGCNHAMNGVPDINAQAQCSSSGASDNSIQITYQGAKTDGANNLSNLPDSALDCAYENVAGSPSVLEKTNGFVVNRYFLKDDTKDDNEPSFACQGNVSGVTKILVPGIQEMAFRYVVTVPEFDSSKSLINSDSGSVITAYKTADDVKKNPLGWSGVVGVEVCLVVGTKFPDGTFGVALTHKQEIRPTCSRDGSGKLTSTRKTEIEKERFFERYIRTFSLPNSLYAPIN